MEAEWWTSPLEDEEGNRIMVTGRADVKKYRDNPRFNIRITVTIPYVADAEGMPSNPKASAPQSEDKPTLAYATMLEEILENFQAELKKDPVAVLTGIYTGAGKREMVFYAQSTNIFNKKLNSALAPLPLLTLDITAENDPDWAEYDEMRELSEIN